MSQKQKKQPNYYSLSILQTLKQLKAKKQGLDLEQVKKRLKKYGSNSLPEKRRLTKTRIFLSQFANSLTYILLIAVFISFAIGHNLDAYIILAAVFINVIVGFFQENKAETALLSLKKIIVYKSKVKREGKIAEIESLKLVPGDILILEAGDKIPADCRILKADFLETSEAVLTGESMPVSKDSRSIKQKALALAEQKNMLFAGTIVNQGRAEAVAVRTGRHSQIGKIASSLQRKSELTPLQSKLKKFSKKIALITLWLAALIFATGVAANLDAKEMFVIAVAAAVAAIPEGLLVGVTVVLAVGMQRILKEKALVRKLLAAETLGSTTVICVDKTGTLTQGEMRLNTIITSSQDFSEGEIHHTQKSQDKQSHELFTALKIGLLCNNAYFAGEKEEQKVKGDQIEKALLLAGTQAGLSKTRLEQEEKRIREIPFDSHVRFMATIHKRNKSEKVIYLKGAPEVLLSHSRYYLKGEGTAILTLNRRQEWKEEILKLSSQGFRVLACAYEVTNKELDPDLSAKDLLDSESKIVFAGLYAFKDPLRPDVKSSLKLCQKAGIKIIMMTGDHRLTAKAIAGQLGFPTEEENILEGYKLNKLSDEELEKVLPKISVIARVVPEDKLRIVKLLQEHDEAVAMTGDGVNDAPALNKANIGVALGSGTDVAHSTADLVLLNDKFSTIVKAVKEGRIIFENIRKIILYLLSDSFSEIFLILMSIVLHIPLPITAAQILWINLVTDGFPHLALAVGEKGRAGVMDEPPRSRKEPLINKEIKLLIILISSITAFSVLGLFWLIKSSTGDLALARTVAFTALAVDSLLYVFSVRSLKQPLWKSKILSNKLLLIAVAMGFVVQIIGVYLPWLQHILGTVALGLKEWILVIAVGIGVIFMVEVVKKIFMSQKKPG